MQQRVLEFCRLDGCFGILNGIEFRLDFRALRQQIRRNVFVIVAFATILVAMHEADATGSHHSKEDFPFGNRVLGPNEGFENC
jgi:hypothetical protein